MIQTLEEALKKINELDQKNKQLEAELEKYKNRAYAGRKKHDSAWMQSYNAFVVQYEKGKTIMEISGLMKQSISVTTGTEKAMFMHSLYFLWIMNGIYIK